MRLNKEIIIQNKLPSDFETPPLSVFQLPEKVLQFGTGVLLRGLIDCYIDKANKQNIFNGRIVVVKSTGINVDEFAEQDCLYTHCIKGFISKNLVEEYIVNASISKVFSASLRWKEITKYAESADMQIIISNTTETGIVLKTDDNINDIPPASFPAKLLAFLYRRYQYFEGSMESGMIIIPTELIVDNGNKLKQILIELAAINKLDNSFIDWLNNANEFCNSLVDRIVPGALKKHEQDEFEKQTGYADNLAIISEAYSLWAIETSSEKTKDILSFSKADKNILISPDINKYRELKLRLLNGTHTFSCGPAFLAGFQFVNEAMQENFMRSYIKGLMMQEILLCITGSAISVEEATAFANTVIDRFSNPFIEHKWLNITLQYTTKMKMRNMPLLINYFKIKNKLPLRMAAGFAAYILFMKPVLHKDESYFGMNNETAYKIDDDKAAYFYELWKENNADVVVKKVLSNAELWDADLTSLPGFCDAVNNFINAFMKGNFKDVIEKLSNNVN